MVSLDGYDHIIYRGDNVSDISRFVKSRGGDISLQNKKQPAEFFVEDYTRRVSMTSIPSNTVIAVNGDELPENHVLIYFGDVFHIHPLEKFGITVNNNEEEVSEMDTDYEDHPRFILHEDNFHEFAQWVIEHGGRISIGVEGSQWKSPFDPSSQTMVEPKHFAAGLMVFINDDIQVRPESIVYAVKCKTYGDDGFTEDMTFFVTPLEDVSKDKSTEPELVVTKTNCEACIHCKYGDGTCWHPSEVFMFDPGDCGRILDSYSGECPNFEKETND